MRQIHDLHRNFTLAALLLAASLPMQSTGAQEALADPQVEAPRGRLNVPLRTLGGRQFWADELLFHDWRISRNSVTGHYRLLDGNNRRHAWGSFEACQARLEEIKRQRSLPAMKGKVVVVLHGLFRTRNSMTALGQHLQDEGDYQVLRMGYPTSRADIGEHAAGLAKVLSHLDKAEEIHFVGHSLGNLVVRQYLADQTDPKRGLKPDPRIGRIVMLGPPNQGADLARMLDRLRMYRWVVRGTGEQLASDAVDLNQQLATPTQPFGIIAGGKGDGAGYNRLLDGDDDFIVRVEETKLPGAHDFVMVPVMHAFMMKDATVKEYTLRFLQHGHFIAADARTPLPKVEARP